MKFLDEAKVHVQSASGGNGCVSFRREKNIAFGNEQIADQGDSAHSDKKPESKET